MALSDFSSPLEWALDLDSRWPERVDMRRVLLELITGHITRSGHPARVLELGIGDGSVLETLSRRHGDAQCVGLDINAALIEFVRQRLQTHPNVEIIAQDLSASNWGDAIGANYDVVYSLQSIHDLGGYDALQAVYQQAHALLVPGGLLANVDFIESFPQDDPAKPRRFPFPQHESLLQRLGFSQITLTASRGKLGAMVGVRPA